MLQESPVQPRHIPVDARPNHGTPKRLLVPNLLHPAAAKTASYYANPGDRFGLVTTALAGHVTPYTRPPIGSADLWTSALSLELQQNIPSKTPSATIA